MNIFFMISQKICYCPNGLNDSRSQEAKERLYVTVMLLTSLTPCLRFFGVCQFITPDAACIFFGASAHEGLLPGLCAADTSA